MELQQKQCSCLTELKVNNFGIWVFLSVPVAARSKAWVCGRLLAWISVSNLAWGECVCRECCVVQVQVFATI